MRMTYHCLCLSHLADVALGDDCMVMPLQVIPLVTSFYDQARYIYTPAPLLSGSSRERTCVILSQTTREEAYFEAILPCVVRQVTDLCQASRRGESSEEIPSPPSPGTCSRSAQKRGFKTTLLTLTADI